MARVGRPRNFDRDEAITKAMHLFWEKGYEPTSLAELKAQLGNLSSASFYAAFGSKQQLFEECLAKYMTMCEALNQPLEDTSMSARSAMYAMLKKTIEAQLDSQTPKGCMAVLAGLNCDDDNQAICRVSEQARHQTRQALVRCVQRGVEQHELSEKTDVLSFAMVFDSFLKGLSIEIRDGATLATLTQALDFIMTMWDCHACRLD
ncbi:TetR/AcrR family transcriptional regulator [Vibrio tritonius]|uniref:TetR/AcrR family transcriptional regulator n=1 Tax=Vibrio tritonius TaxID=1435069 RepID=UPI0009E7235E|nr:TetR/AcrR family transcriptional regulator [Vibrio tritonius]